MTFLIFCFAMYRITRVILDDSLFSGLRQRFYLRFPPTKEFANLNKYPMDDGRVYWKKDGPTRKISKFGQLLHCYWCIGFWICGIGTLIFANATNIQNGILWWFASSAVVGLVAINLDRD